MLGFSGTYPKIEINERRTAAQETDIDAIQLTAHGVRQLGAWQFSGQLSYIDGDSYSTWAGRD